MKSTHRSPYATHEQEYLAWYQRRFANPGKPFDPATFVQAVQRQFPDQPARAQAFARCTREWPETYEELYTYFLPPCDHASRWKYAGGFMFRHPQLGTLAVDTIHDADAPGGIAIGGIEYLDRVLGWRRA